MPEHPCAKGLTSACFKAYPAWARQAVAYKLLHAILPKQLSRELPKGLGRALIGPGAIIPSGVVLPPGMVIPPNFTFPDRWVPWLYFNFLTGELPWTLFPEGWKEGDPLPPGVTYAPGFVLPPGWTPEDPPPAALIPGYTPVATPPDSGATPPLYVAPFSPGPVHRPSAGLGINEYTVSFFPTKTGWAQNTDPDWWTCRNTDSMLQWEWETINDITPISVSLYSGSYSIKRTYNRFPLTGFPPGATIISAKLSLKLYSGEFITARAYTTISDVDDFPPNYLDVWNIHSDPVTLFLGENIFNLSGDAIAVLQNKIGENCDINARESDHDYGDVPPDPESEYTPYFYNCNASNENKPILTIIYKA